MTGASHPASQSTDFKLRKLAGGRLGLGRQKFWPVRALFVFDKDPNWFGFFCWWKLPRPFPMEILNFNIFDLAHFFASLIIALFIFLELFNLHILFWKFLTSMHCFRYGGMSASTLARRLDYQYHWHNITFFEYFDIPRSRHLKWGFYFIIFYIKLVLFVLLVNFSIMWKRRWFLHMPLKQKMGVTHQQLNKNCKKYVF